MDRRVSDTHGITVGITIDKTKHRAKFQENLGGKGNECGDTDLGQQHVFGWNQYVHRMVASQAGQLLQSAPHRF